LRKNKWWAVEQQDQEFLPFSLCVASVMVRILYGLALFVVVVSAETESGSERSEHLRRRTSDIEDAEQEWAEVAAASAANEDAASREVLTKKALHKQGLYTAKGDPEAAHPKHKKAHHCDDTVESIGILGQAFLWFAALCFFLVCNVFFGILASPPHFKGNKTASLEQRSSPPRPTVQPSTVHRPPNIRLFSIYIWISLCNRSPNDAE
jgi:hypothetical protein